MFHRIHTETVNSNDYLCFGNSTSTDFYTFMGCPKKSSHVSNGVTRHYLSVPGYSSLRTISNGGVPNSVEWQEAQLKASVCVGGSGFTDLTKPANTKMVSASVWEGSSGIQTVYGHNSVGPVIQGVGVDGSQNPVWLFNI